MKQKHFFSQGVRRMLTLFLVMFVSIGMWAQVEKIYSGFNATAGSDGFRDTEDYPNLVDGKFRESDYTKWCVSMIEAYIQGETYGYLYVDFNSNSPIYINKYILTTANDNSDSPNRNPKSWILKAKANASDSWTTIATVSNDQTLQDVNFTDYKFNLQKAGTFRYFRFMVSETRGASLMQLGELRLVYALLGSGTASDPYLIHNTNEWNMFCGAVNDGTGADKYYKLSDNFNNSSSPAILMAGTQEHPFTGHFDGNGRTLTVNINSSEANTAPFRFIGGATIVNLTVAGTVTSSGNHVSGFVGGCISNTTNLIKGCTVTANVVGSTYAGGFIGHGGAGDSSHGPTIQDCIFSGNISGFANYAGGLLGWCDNLTFRITNCLFKGSFTPSGSGKYHPVALKYTNRTCSATVSQTYYLTNSSPTATGGYCVPGAEGIGVSTTQYANMMNRVYKAVDNQNYYQQTIVSGVESIYELQGSPIQPVPVVKDAQGNTISSDCYNVTYSGNGAAQGSYTLTVTGIQSKGCVGSTVVAYYLISYLPTPTALAATNVSSTGVTLGWTENGSATAWEICLNDDETNLVVANSNPFRLMGLTSETAYSVKVRAIGGDYISKWSDSVSFFASDKRDIGTGTATGDNTVPIYPYSTHALCEQIYTTEELGPAGVIQSIDLFSTSIYLRRNLDIYLAHTTKSSFGSKTDWINVTAADLVYSGNVAFNQNEWTTIELTTPFAYNGSDNVVFVVDDNTGESRFDNSTFYVYGANNMSIYTYNYTTDDPNDFDPTNITAEGYLLNIKNRLRLEINTSAHYMAKPKDLTVSNIQGNSVQVSWTSNDASAWEICLNGDEAHIVSATSNPFTLNDLYLGTTYEVKVRAVSGSDVSSWSKPITFNTDPCMPEYQCAISYEISDTYGEGIGWYDDAIRVVDVTANLVLATLTYGDNETGIGTQNVCIGDTIRFEWVSGRAPAICKYAFYDGNGDEIFAGVGALASPVEYIVDCTTSPLKKPTNLAVSEIGSAKVHLNWRERGSATAWVVAYKSDNATSFTEVSADTYDFTLTGLNPTTNYTVKVCATDGVNRGKWSAPETFTTLEYNPVPFNVEILPNGTTATVNWMGDSQNYNVRYRKAAETVSPFFEGFNDKSLILPDGWTNIKQSEKGAWFISAPYPEHYTDEDGNPRIYGDAYIRSDNAAGGIDSWLITPQITLDGTMSVWLRPFYIRDERQFAIYLSTTGDSISDFTTTLVPPTIAGSKYTEYTADLTSYAGQKGYIAIRHFGNTGSEWGFLLMENFSILLPSIPAGPWTTINTTEKTCELTGLEMGTRYEVQIQGITGSDQSNWCNIIPFTAHIPAPAFDVLEMSQSAYVFPRNNTDTYEISYKPSSASEWTSVVASSEKYRITGLTASTNYDIRLRNVIGENTSDWNIQTFTTAAAGSAYGDVNRDDKISLGDITAIINIMTGKPGNYNVEGADYNGDDVVDKFDLKNWLRMLFNYFLE